LVSSAEVDFTTKDAPAFDTDYECCECLGTYKEDAEMGMGEMWMWSR